MPFDPDDPRLTAYALGELDAADRAAVEAILRDDPDARAFVLGIEETARILADEFRREASASDGLGPDRRGAIEECLASGEAPDAPTIPIAAAPARARFRAWIPLAAAGILGAAGVLGLSAMRSHREAPVELAQADRPAMPAAPAPPTAGAGALGEVAIPGSGNQAEPPRSAESLAGRAEGPASTSGMAVHSSKSEAPGRPSDRLAAAVEPAGPGAKPNSPPPAASAAAPVVPRMMRNLAGEGMTGMGGTGGGMGGFGGVTGGPGALNPQPGAVALAGTEVRRQRGFGYGMGRPGGAPMPGAGPQPARDQAAGNRLPVVGTQGAGIANFTPNLNSPATRSFYRQNASNAVMTGQPLPGLLDQNQVSNGQPAPNTSGVYNFTTSIANAPAKPSQLAQQVGQPGQNAASAGQNLGIDAARLGRGVVDSKSKDLKDLSRSKRESYARVEPATASQQPGQQPGNQPQSGNPAQQQGQQGQGQPGQGQGQKPGASNAGQATTESYQLLPRGVVEPEALLKEAQARQAPADGRVAFDKHPQQATLNQQVDLEAAASKKLDAGVAGQTAQAPPTSEPAQQVALLDEAAKARLDEVGREVESKRAEVRRLAEEAEVLRKQAAREQTRVDREAYARFYDHPFLAVVPGNELSTFSIDVDTGSYANVRRFLSEGQLPPPDAVRIEELLNYFRYDDPAPKGDEPFSITTEVTACPWDGGRRLMRVGLKGKTIDADKRPTSNLVFLVDVSGSMSDLNKLPLLKAGMKLLVEQLTENDRVGIVTYANDVREAFPSTPCHRKAEILAAIDALGAGGGTNGGGGIQRAYAMAEKNFIKGGTNRVILATDGDFNVGLSKDQLLATSAERAKSGVFLTVLGFGEGNLQDDFMEQLADKGNGHYAYIDTIDEARKVLVREMSGTLVAIAKDVKIQVEFNPEKVASYRLIGYENRAMAAEDFRDDRKDAGEIGAGHSVTALYEIVPAAPTAAKVAADRPLKYRRSRGDAVDKDGANPELLTVFLRYKEPDGDKAKEISRAVVDDGRDFGRASADLKFSASVAGFGMLLRGSPYKGSLTYAAVQEIASAALGDDPTGDRKGFLELVRRAGQIDGSLTPDAPR